MTFTITAHALWCIGKYALAFGGGYATCLIIQRIAFFRAFRGIW